MLRHPEVDVVIVGVGWAGSVIAAKLAQAGLAVVGLERGGMPPAGMAPSEAEDELRYFRRAELRQNLALESWTLRHHLGEAALPLRGGTSFRPGEGVGGSGVAWGAVCRRWLPHHFALRTELVHRYGPDALPEGHSVQDWPIDYEVLERYYDEFEHLIGVTGVAGVVSGERRRGGNPFEGSRQREYPLPPLAGSESTRAFSAAASALGLHPYPQPTGNASVAYENPDGVRRGACTYCGRCAFHPCAVDAKATPLVTTLPVAHATGNFELRTDARVFRVNHHRGRARSVFYRDSEGRHHEQPAAIVVLAAYTLGNVRLLLLSGVGTPYDPVSGAGVVGRNYTYQAGSSSHGFFEDREFERYRGANGVAVCVDDLSPLADPAAGFVGGGSLACRVVGGPLTSFPLPPGTPEWGAEWKSALRAWSRRSVTVTSSGDVLAYRKHHLDLDPTYTDAWGDPLLRITFDWKPNERALVHSLGRMAGRVLREMGASIVHEGIRLADRYDGSTYQSTHNNGGAIMGGDPASSVVNSYLQSWDLPNLFVVGASAFPQNSGHGPTGTVGALALRAAEGILECVRDMETLS